MKDGEKKYQEYIATSLNKKIFSGIAIGYSKLGKGGVFDRFFNYAGFTEGQEKKHRVDRTIFFDLASLTKPLVTALCSFNLLNDGCIDWHERISSLLSKKVKGEMADITLFHLLSHSSGLPDYRPYYMDYEKKDPAVVKEEIVNRILNEKLMYCPGEKKQYSDLGYILLGAILEKKAKKDLNLLWTKTIAESFCLQEKLLYLKNKDIGPEKCMATSFNKAKQKPVCGIVNDDNCRVMGGVAGHAGLFGTLEGTVSICEEILKKYKNISSSKVFSNKILQEAVNKSVRLPRVCGFDRPDKNNSSCGHYFSEMSVGHLGFTGTSFWIDLEKGLVIVILTNKVFMGTSKEIMFMFRRKIHDMIMERDRDV